LLKPFLNKKNIEAGCDEAGRGCLAGPVFAAAVILPKGFKNKLLTDSKQLTEKQRDQLRLIIENETQWAVATCSPEEIDQLNILWASVAAMHKALDVLAARQQFNHILVDGNRFKPFGEIEYSCIVKGDATYMSIAAASILAKTHRDEYMKDADNKFPGYGWRENKGYPTKTHREAIRQLGITPLHRKSFRLLPEQLALF
jgi:ribonuclease HII